MEDLRLARWSAVPGLVHGFGRRPPQVETRAETRARVTDTLRDQGRLQLLTQVHGTTLVAAPCDGTPTADASTAEQPGVLLGIETADCLPVLFVDPERRRAAAAHAGWRGTAAGIAERVVERLVERGSAARDLWVALGPCIGACCYEVGDELAAQFQEPDRAFFAPGPQGRPHLDVRGLNVRQLTAAGVLRENIVHGDECTRCQAERYCSYRRDGAGTGRMISYVGWAAAR